MAIVKGPLMSFDASGSIAKTVVFSKWKGRNYVRKLVIPANPKSGLQVGMRAVLKFTTQMYATMPAATKAEWAAIAADDAITALNAQVARCQRLARRNLGWVKGPAAAAGTTPSAPSGPSGTVQPGAVVVDWTPGANDAEYAWVIHMALGSTITVAIANLVASVDFNLNETTILVPDSSVEMTFGIRGLNEDGEFGPDASVTVN